MCTHNFYSFPLYPSEALCHHRTGSTLVQVMACCLNGLLSESTKPLPAPKLTCHQKGPLSFSWGQFHDKSSRHHWLQHVLNYIFEITATSARSQWVNQATPVYVIWYSFLGISLSSAPLSSISLLRWYMTIIATFSKCTSPLDQCQQHRFVTTCTVVSW